MTINATGTATDPLGASDSPTLAIAQGSGDLDTVVHYLQKNRPNWDSLVGTGSQGPTFGSGDIETGNVFDVLQACTLTGVRIFKNPAATGSIPVTVWDFATHDVLGSATLTWEADDGGWVEFDLDSPVDLAVGTRYCVSYYSNACCYTFWRFNAQDYYEWPFHVIGGAPKNSAGVTLGGGAELNASHAFPVDVTANWYWIDPRVEYTSELATYKGGSDYFGQWPNADDEDFPIGVFDADVGTIAAYKAVGVNWIMAYDLAGSRDEIVSSGAGVVAFGNADNARLVVSDAALGACVKAYYYWDEPDEQGNGATPATLQAAFVAVRQIDSTRPLYFGFGAGMLQGQSFGWYPNGATPDITTANWRQSATLTDIVTGDNYSINTGAGIWNYGIQADRLRDINDDATPVHVTVETCIQVGGILQPSATQLQCAAIQAIIHGARGIMWFDHQFAYSAPDGTNYPQDFQVMLDDPTKKSALTAFHSFLQSIKGALWAAESSDYTVIVDSSTKTGSVVGGEIGVPIDVTVREGGDTYLYVIAQAARPGTTTGTFTLTGAASQTLTVLGESRTVAADSDGVFTDDFGSDYEYHVYQMPLPVAPIITTTTADPLEESVAYSKQWEALGETPITWSAADLPSGLSMSSGGLLSGTPSASGAYSFTVTATNSHGNSNKGYSGTIAAAPTPPTITTSSLPDMTQSSPVSTTLAASGTTPITWAVTAGTLPDGLSLSTGGALTGTPTAQGDYDFTVTATNAGGHDTKEYTGTIGAPTVVEHSVFAATTPATPTVGNDGPDGMITGNQFYTYGTPAYSGWLIVGVRIYVPSGTSSSLLSQSGSIYLQRSGDGSIYESSYDKQGLIDGISENGAETAFSSLVEGWNNIYFDDTWALTFGGGFFVGISWDTGGWYIYNALDSAATEKQATDGTRVALVATTSGGLSDAERGINGVPQDTSNWSTAWYGLDVILREP